MYKFIGIGSLFICMIVTYNIFYPLQPHQIKHNNLMRIDRYKEAHIAVPYKHYESSKLLASKLRMRRQRLLHIRRLKQQGKSVDDIINITVNWSWI